MINEAGNVCGVVSAGAVLEDGNGSTLSLLYPTLPVSLNVVWTPHPKFAMNVAMPLILAVDRGLVKSDGSHRRHRIVADQGLFRVDPLIQKSQLSGVFDNRGDFWDERPSKPLEAEDPRNA